jgi:hypothetical protein
MSLSEVLKIALKVKKNKRTAKKEDILMIASSPLKREPLSQRAQEIKKKNIRNLAQNRNNPTSRRDLDKKYGPYSDLVDKNSAVFNRSGSRRERSGSQKSDNSSWAREGKADRNKYQRRMIDDEDVEADSGIMDRLKNIDIPGTDMPSSFRNSRNSSMNRVKPYHKASQRGQFSKKNQPSNQDLSNVRNNKGRKSKDPRHSKGRENIDTSREDILSRFKSSKHSSNRASKPSLNESKSMYKQSTINSYVDPPFESNSQTPSPKNAFTGLKHERTPSPSCKLPPSIKNQLI